MADRFASCVVSTRRHLVALVEANSRLEELGPIHIGWKCQIIVNGQMEQEISEKKDNLEGLTKTLEKNFRKRSVPFVFEPEFPLSLFE